MNEAIRALEDQHNFRTMETLATATTADTVRVLLPVPANWKEPNGRPWRVSSDTGFRQRLQYAPTREAVGGLYSLTDTGAPTHLLRTEPTDAGVSNFEVWPLSDVNSDYTNGEYRVVVPYWRYLPALSADSDTNWFTTNAQEYIIHVAAGMAFSLDWDENRLALWTQLAKGFEQRAIKRDKMQRIMGGAPTLVPYWRGANAPVSGEA